MIKTELPDLLLDDKAFEEIKAEIDKEVEILVIDEVKEEEIEKIIKDCNTVKIK